MGSFNLEIAGFSEDIPSIKQKTLGPDVFPSSTLALIHSRQDLLSNSPSSHVIPHYIQHHTNMFYEPGKTDHGLPRDPFKRSSPNLSLPYNRVKSETKLIPPGMRRPPPHRLDLHALRRRHRQPSAQLTVQQPNLRPPLLNVLREPEQHRFAQRHDHQRRNPPRVRLEPRYLRPPRESINITAEETPYGVDEFRARWAPEGGCEVGQCTDGEGKSGEVRV